MHLNFRKLNFSWINPIEEHLLANSNNVARKSNSQKRFKNIHENLNQKIPNIKILYYDGLKFK